MSFLTLSAVRKQYGASVAVEEVSLQIERGEFISFLGPSGCGKTTTLRMVAGFEQPSAGAIALGGADITRLPPNRRNVGMVFQSYALFPNMTVAQNIAFGLRLRRVERAAAERRVAELLRLIHLPDLGARYPQQLSGGQQQRVALARALAIEPQVLLLDEPLSALDAKIRVALRAEIRAIQRELGITTIYVTHDQEEALALSDRIVVMNRGRVEQVGAPFQIYNFPQTPFVAAFVGTLNVLKGRLVDPASGRVAVDGQELTAARAAGARAAGAPITLALRPEVVTLDAEGGPNRLRGTVEEVTFLGALVQVRARLDEQTLLFNLFNSPQLSVPQRGQPLALSVPADALLVLSEEPGV